MIQKNKKELKIAKTLTLVMILFFAIIGVILLFMPGSKERMEAYKLLLSAIFPYLLPVLGGVSIKGILDGVLKNKTFSGRSPEEIKIEDCKNE